jgi:hypothetical protein
MSRELYALTVLQPFATGIASWGKDVENRTWLPGRRLPVGAWLAIHAGKQNYPDADSPEFRDWLAVTAGPFLPADLTDVRVERHVGNRESRWRTVRAGYLAALPRSAVVAVVRVAALSDPAAKASPWAVPGHEQWRVDRVHALAVPVPCKGAQGLWRVPDDVVAAVRAGPAGATLAVYPVCP